jgi:hypothetical protein
MARLLQLRQFTSNELTSDQDEYVPTDYDEAGERKLDGDGGLLGSRTYRIRTFQLPGRGSKLFMMATDCAKELNYRDSYLLFHKNRSLYKLIATQAEKDSLITANLLPYSFRSRQIALITARSMFRQFGARIVVGGKRVLDDYWQNVAIQQGFTENDPISLNKRSVSTTGYETSPLQHVKPVDLQATVHIHQHQSAQPGTTQPIIDPPTPSPTSLNQSLSSRESQLFTPHRLADPIPAAVPPSPPTLNQPAKTVANVSTTTTATNSFIPPIIDPLREPPQPLPMAEAPRQLNGSVFDNRGLSSSSVMSGSSMMNVPIPSADERAAGQAANALAGLLGQTSSFFIPGSDVHGSIDFQDPSLGPTVLTGRTKTKTEVVEAQHMACQFTKYLNEQRRARKPMWSEFWSTTEQRNRDKLDQEEEDLQLNGYQVDRLPVDILMRTYPGGLEVDKPPPMRVPDPPLVQRMMQQQMLKGGKDADMAGGMHMSKQMQQQYQHQYQQAQMRARQQQLLRQQAGGGGYQHGPPPQQGFPGQLRDSNWKGQPGAWNNYR